MTKHKHIYKFEEGTKYVKRCKCGKGRKMTMFNGWVDENEQPST